MQPRIQVHTEPLPQAATEPSDSPTPPFLVLRDTGRPLVLAITPPGETLPVSPRPPQRRPSPALPFLLGFMTFATSYAVTGVFAHWAKERCTDEFAEKICRRHASTQMIPVAGPILVANQPRAPRDYVLAGFQGAGLLLMMIGVVLLVKEGQRRSALGPQGVRIAGNTAIRPDAGPAGAQLTVHGRF